MQIDGFGTIDTSLFYEEIPIGSTGASTDGVWIVSRSPPVDRFNTNIQAFDIYSRYKNKLTGEIKLKSILDYLQTSYGTVCNLPSCPPYTTQEYSNVTIEPTSGVENVGVDANGKVVRAISGIIYYTKK